MKKRNKVCIITAGFLCICSIACAGTAPGRIREGNILFEKNDYENAVKKYTDAQIDRPESPEIFFNIACVLYKQRKYADAEKMLEKAVPGASPELEAKIYYNIGNSKYKQGQLRESIDFYKKALSLNPEDKDAKYNIEFVEKKIKEMMSRAKKKQQKEQNKKGKGRKGQKKNTAAEKLNESGRSETQSVREGTKKETQSAGEGMKKEAQAAGAEKKERRKAEKPGSKKGMSKKEAEALLKMAADDERGVKKRRKQKGNRRAYYPEVEKPW